MLLHYQSVIKQMSIKHPVPSQIINTFLNSIISANHEKGYGTDVVKYYQSLVKKNLHAVRIQGKRMIEPMTICGSRSRLPGSGNKMDPW